MREQLHGKNGRYKKAHPYANRILDLWAARTPTFQIRAATNTTTQQIRYAVEVARRHGDVRAINRRDHPVRAPVGERPAQRIVEAIRNFQEKHGRAPSQKEIIHAMGLAAHGGVVCRGFQRLRADKRIRLLYVIEERV
jgi:hypothetical protein